MIKPEPKKHPVSSTSSASPLESAEGQADRSAVDSEPKQANLSKSISKNAESEETRLGENAKGGSVGQNNGDSESKSESEETNDNDYDFEWNPDEMEILLREAKALNEYLARHGAEPTEQISGKKLDLQLVQGHSHLIDAIAAATKRASAENWKKLSKAYSHVSGATYQKYKVSGKTIVDTLNGRRGIISKKNVPVLIGIGLFVLALVVEYMIAWTGRIPDTVQEPSGNYSFIYHATLNLAPFVVPAIWGAIGACVFLSKRISDLLYAMSYEVNKMQGIIPRIFLGAILGFITVFLLFDTSEVLKPVAIGDVKIGPIVAAFVAGLSVKPIYRGFESLSEGIAKRFSPDK